MAALAEAFELREVRDPERPPMTDLAEWSRQHGHIDTARAHPNTTRPMDVLHGQTVPGMLKELSVLALVSNLVCMVTGRSAMRQHINVERTSFQGALRWLGAPHTGMSRMALMVNLKRPHREEPRIKKWRLKSFPLMLKSWQALRQ